jgi:outer membrane protein insertion porin family
MGKALLILLVLASTASASPQIEFVGNKSIPTQTLRKEMSVGSFDEQLERITDYYRDHGFPTVELGVPVIERDRVTIPVEEGEQYSVGNVSVTGTLVGDVGDHLKLVAVQAGDVFSRARIMAGTRALARRYAERGYPDAAILPITTLDLDSRLIALTYDVTPGKRILPRTR